MESEYFIVFPCKFHVFSCSFTSMLGSTQADMKFTYCAVGICYMLNSWETINVPALVEYILSSQVSSSIFHLYSNVRKYFLRLYIIGAACVHAFMYIHVYIIFRVMKEVLAKVQV